MNDDVCLGRPTLVGARAQPVTDHLPSIILRQTVGGLTRNKQNFKLRD